ncbi:MULTISPECIES: tyrosine-type recombinase/integrase [Burkholderiaceae]|uniref:Integrase family protein n=1 Tax=Paraburkholderia phytofirmans (strain DSM 17436 / LMG 22146 / PsJN) TaxID=398527 RepID=B2T0V0_PARPJ|nr:MULTISPECIES: tyrosine-type recombinase/integrase [Burkholderiaceae]UTP22394.1 site-specific integrase [Burkholderia sp. FXe9]ACD14670.1 integrase family protein [Paraburkholderia phytofirmans PsJN]MBR8394719.1 tyrosine-type recombinase/integrase [Burkholderia cenocepacia]MBY4818459.1 site-specific integrase [Burkholderia contaminans]MDR8399143.1 site-specific integrase [Paraburkholderia sp. USG1]
MSQSDYSFWLDRLKQYLQDERYGKSVVRKYPHAVRRFLRDVAQHGQALEAISPTDVGQYLDRLRTRDQHALSTFSRNENRMAIHMLLRLVHNGDWPTQTMRDSAEDVAIHQVVAEYDAWMTEVRGLSAGTRQHNRFEARSLLRWLDDHGKNLTTVNVADLDAYIASRVASMRRRTKGTMVGTLRGVLRYLHSSGRMSIDLSVAIEATSAYAMEDIPSTIRPEDIDWVLDIVRRDCSPLGRRDYALLTLLTTYGLRAGEVLGMCLSDVDWHRERLRIQHTKTGSCSELPLMRLPADALLDYLCHGRPVTTQRLIFLRGRAPYQPLSGSAALHSMISRRFRAAGVSLPGKRGPHVLRHSRAASLLSGGVSIKVIGDVLGHRSERSTAVYLKLATDDLMAISLDLPQGAAS